MKNGHQNNFVEIKQLIRKKNKPPSDLNVLLILAALQKARLACTPSTCLFAVGRIEFRGFETSNHEQKSDC